MTLALVSATYLLGAHVLTAWLVAFFYLGREITQAEYRIIQSRFDGKRANAPWWCAAMPTSWTAKAVLDCIGPVGIAVLFFDHLTEF